MFRVLYINLCHHAEFKLQHLTDWSKHGIMIDTCPCEPDFTMQVLAEFDYSLAVIHMNDAPKQGLELCRQIRAQHRLPIIVIEDSLDYHIIREALRLQISDYLPSDLPTDEIKNSIINLKLKQHPNEDDVIQKIKEYVERMMHRNITLKEISQIFHFNRSYLGQKFKNEENISFNEYLLIQRMEKAKVLLEQTDMKVYEIANEVGYTEIDWFYKRFKNYTGVSANEYRKMVAS